MPPMLLVMGPIRTQRKARDPNGLLIPVGLLHRYPDPLSWTNRPEVPLHHNGMLPGLLPLFQLPIQLPLDHLYPKFPLRRTP